MHSVSAAIHPVKLFQFQFQEFCKCLIPIMISRQKYNHSRTYSYSRMKTPQCSHTSRVPLMPGPFAMMEWHTHTTHIHNKQIGLIILQKLGVIGHRSNGSAVTALTDRCTHRTDSINSAADAGGNYAPVTPEIQLKPGIYDRGIGKPWVNALITFRLSEGPPLGELWNCGPAGLSFL